jgi:hypothetical protein
VRNGIESAELARAGITGPRRFLIGDRGLYRLFTHREVGDEAAADFLPRVANFMPGLSYKPYCCCAATFAYIEAMARFQDRAGPVLSPAEVMAGEMGLVNTFMRTVAYPGSDGIPIARTPAQLSEGAVADPARPPRLGEHSEAVLAEYGFPEAEIAGLRATGVIWSHGVARGQA